MFICHVKGFVKWHTIFIIPNSLIGTNTLHKETPMQNIKELFDLSYNYCV
jgi:hypothetical protein